MAIIKTIKTPDGTVYDIQDTTYSAATTSAAGLMSAADKTKLNGIASGATANVGTITGIKMNGASKGTSGVVDLGTVITAHQDISGKLNSSLKGAANGLAELDANGKVPSSQLPSFVDDVLEYTSSSSFPETGETGKIYVAADTNKTYRWSGTAYVEISASLALGETSSTAYRGDRGKTAYDHASAKGSAFSSGLYKITTNAQGHVTAATAVAKSDITGLGIPGQDTTYSSKAAASGGTDVSLVTTGEKAIWNAKTSNTGTVTSVAASGSGGITISGSPVTTSGTIGIGLNLNTAINGLSTGDSTPADNDYIITQYVNGGTTTTTYHRRPISKIWDYIKSKITKTVVTDALGYTPPTTDTNTHRPIQVNGTEVLGNNTTALNLKAGSNVTVTNSSGTVTIAATDTTYSSKTAASGGTDVSLVTTGEKYTWNNKASTAAATTSAAGLMSAADKTKLNGIAEGATANTGTITGITMNGASKGTSGVVNLGTVITAHQDISGKVSGPSSATSGRVAVFDGTTGKVIKDSGYTIAKSVPSDAKFTDTTYSSKTAASGGTDVSLVTTGEKYTWNNKASTATATGSAAGLMSAEDKTKLNGIAEGATANVGTITGIKMNGSSKGTSGVVDLGTVITSHQDISGKANLASPAFTGTPTAPTAAAGTNTTQIATTAFVMAAFQANDAMVFKGTIGSSGATVTSLPATHYQGWTYKVITAGTYAGKVCEIGDMIICVTDGTTATDSHWTVVQSNIDGAVTGPASATSGRVAVFDGTTGKVIKDSGYTIAKSVPSDAKFTDTTYSAATTSAAGLMSADDKTKLNGIATGATANVGTITGIKMNGSSKGTSGVVDLGTVITSHQDISGKVSGPSSVTSGRVAVFDGTTGKVIKDSGYTIAKSVPSDAKFTDTTYSAATTSAAGLMSADDKTKLNGIATGATANVGTITGITMNGASKGTSGVVNLGTVITAHQDISGKVSGPSSSTDAHVAVFNGTGGKTIKDSGYTIAKSVPSDAKFTDTTYSSKTAASGGTDVSLVTTGEKYTWNNKVSRANIAYIEDGTTYSRAYEVGQHILRNGNIYRMKTSVSSGATINENNHMIIIDMGVIDEATQPINLGTIKTLSSLENGVANIFATLRPNEMRACYFNNAGYSFGLFTWTGTWTGTAQRMGNSNIMKVQFHMITPSSGYIEVVGYLGDPVRTWKRYAYKEDISLYTGTTPTSGSAEISVSKDIALIKGWQVLIESSSGVWADWSSLSYWQNNKLYIYLEAHSELRGKSYRVSVFS